LLHLRRDDACIECGEPLPVGTRAYWLKARRVVLCVNCASIEDPAPQPEIMKSTPGASARRMHAQQRKARETRQRAKYGRIGGWAARRSAGPQREQAWRKGASGEEQNARRWEELLAGQPVRLLHDRKLPGKRANFDHIAVGPAGVTVVDSKNLKGKVRVTWQGGLFSPRTFDLRVNGRRRTSLVESVERQVATVADILADEGFVHVPVCGALCLADPQGLPMIKRLQLRDVAIDGPRRIAELIGRHGDLDSVVIERIAVTLSRRLPPA
jgi:hypothetical protein